MAFHFHLFLVILEEEIILGMHLPFAVDFSSLPSNTASSFSTTELLTSGTGESEKSNSMVINSEKEGTFFFLYLGQREY